MGELKQQEESARLQWESMRDDCRALHQKNQELLMEKQKLFAANYKLEEENKQFIDNVKKISDLGNDNADLQRKIIAIRKEEKRVGGEVVGGGGRLGIPLNTCLASRRRGPIKRCINVYSRICSIRRRGYYLFHHAILCGFYSRAATIREWRLLNSVVSAKSFVNVRALRKASFIRSTKN